MTELNVKDLKPHPNNPRYIRDANFQRLVESMKDSPWMLKTRPIVANGDLVVIGGNMRLEAAKHLKWKTIPVEVVDWTEEQQREFMIKDNITQGEFDWDIMSNEWEQDLLLSWGVDPYHFGMSATEKILPVDDDEYYEPKESDAPKLTDGYVKIEFVVKEDQKKHIMKRVREYADQKDLQLGAALFAMLA